MSGDEIPRRGMQAEREWAASAQAIRWKGQMRLISQCEAILQAISWRRRDELNEHEIELEEQARRFIARQSGYIKEKSA